MKNVINKLGMIAIVAILGVAGYMIVNHVGSVENVKIQTVKEKANGKKDEVRNKNAGDSCSRNGQCASNSCVDEKCA